ncbi:hypothetical protein [uncultured Tenacibaculum sp.]|uniref:hypothetical protein n=1 Tax=uncultured Tenacibaculum sp. TaxID=174713 RepID=UPI00261F2AD7|nr:hypothetical protein [uncultured Tenacibaculum sp.]
MENKLDNNKKNDRFKTLSAIRDYTPLLYILLVCTSYVFLNSYYIQFDIKEYLSFQEIIYIFLPISNFIILFIVFQFLHYSYREILHLKERALFVNPKSKSVLKTIPNWIKYIIFYFLLFVFFQMLFNYSKFINEYYYTQFIVFIIAISIIIVILILKLHEILTNQNEKALKPFFITLISAMFTAYVFIQRFEARLILGGVPKYSLQLIRATDTIKTNDSLVYFGETKNYYFLRNLKNNENLIIPNSNIKSIIKRKIK